MFWGALGCLRGMLVAPLFHCSEDIALFSKALAGNGFRTPAELLHAVCDFKKSDPEKPPSAFLTQSPEGGKIFQQMQWTGRMSAAMVMKGIFDNLDRGWETIKSTVFNWP